MNFHFLIPGRIESLTGTLIYEKQITEGLKRKGHTVVIHSLETDFPFASLQSNFAEQVLQNKTSKSGNLDSIILLQDGKFHYQSTAALMIAKRLSGLFPLFYCLMIIPKFVRDGIYSFIANHRYQWFGKRSECWLPTKELNELFYE